MYDLQTISFSAGQHATREEGMCIMEVCAWIAGETHSDHPLCACPVISSFLREWNDGLPDDATRNRLLSQFVFRLPGTKSTEAIELRRGEMALDWLIREQAPLSLELVPELVQYAQQLRELPEITAASQRHRFI